MRVYLALLLAALAILSLVAAKGRYTGPKDLGDPYEIPGH